MQVDPAPHPPPVSYNPCWSSGAVVSLFIAPCKSRGAFPAASKKSLQKGEAGAQPHHPLRAGSQFCGFVPSPCVIQHLSPGRSSSGLVRALLHPSPGLSPACTQPNLASLVFFFQGLRVGFSVEWISWFLRQLKGAEIHALD